MPSPQAIISPPLRTRRPARAARVAGLACGLVATAIAWHGWAIESTGPSLGTDLTVAAVAPGELQVAGSGAVIQAGAMQPGDAAATGSLRLRNITGAPVLVRIRALPSTREADDALELAALVNGRAIAAGPAGTLRRWSTRHVWIDVHGSRLVTLRARMRRPAEGLIADVTLEFSARTVRRR